MTAIRDRIVGLKRIRASELEPHPLNWRTHPDEQRTALQGVMNKVGYAGALVARELDGHYQLIDGHLRAELTPDQEVPVLIVDLDDDETRLLLATLDPLAEMAEADGETLSALVAALDEEGQDLAALVGPIQPFLRLHEPTGDPDAVPEVPEEPISKRGEVYELGPHRLMCGDATSAEDVEALLDGAEPRLMVTDPPYGVEYDPAWRNEAAEKGLLAYADRRVGQVSGDERTDWREAWDLSPADVAYCWHADRHASLVQASLEAARYEIRCQIIWSKPHFPISRGHYHWRHEPCWYAVRKGAQAGWIGDREQTTVWEIALDPNVPGGLSAQKPADCMRRPIHNHEGDVYDPFVGSGTTIIAAELEGRRCWAMEIDPKWCDVARQRYADFVGDQSWAPKP